MWMPCQPGAKVFPGWHAYGATIWNCDPDEWTTGPGLESAPIVWSPSTRRPPPGQEYHGPRDWFQFGIPEEVINNQEGYIESQPQPQHGCPWPIPITVRCTTGIQAVPNVVVPCSPGRTFSGRMQMVIMSGATLIGSYTLFYSTTEYVHPGWFLGGVVLPNGSIVNLSFEWDCSFGLTFFFKSIPSVNFPLVTCYSSGPEVNGGYTDPPFVFTSFPVIMQKTVGGGLCDVAWATWTITVTEV